MTDLETLRADLAAKTRALAEREAECERLRSEILLAHGRGQDVCLERLTKAGGFGEWPGIVPLRDAWRERDTIRAQLAEARAEGERLRERAARDDAGVTIHQCPGKGEGLMPCCGKTPFEVLADRMTTNPVLVNCDRERLRTQLEQAQKRIAECEAHCEMLKDTAAQLEADICARYESRRRDLAAERDRAIERAKDAVRRLEEFEPVVEAVREFQELAGNRDADLDAEINAQRRVMSIALPEKRKP